MVRFAVSAAKSASRMRLLEAERFSDVVCRFEITDAKRFWVAPRLAREPLTFPSAASTAAIAASAPAAVVMLMLAIDEKLLVLVPVIAKTSAFALAVVIVPLLLDKDTVPVFIEESVAAPPVNVTPEKDAVLVVALVLKSKIEISAPSFVVNVNEPLEVDESNVAVIPVSPERPLIAVCTAVRSDLSVTVAEIAFPFKVKLTVPASARLPNVAELVAVAVMPIELAAVLMAAAMAFASELTA